MSTKAIREVLEQMRSQEGQRSDNDRVEWAIRELEAIEKAARDWHEDDMGNWVQVGELNDMANLLRAIAKQER